jgi:hypothetical protein
MLIKVVKCKFILTFEYLLKASRSFVDNEHVCNLLSYLIVIYGVENYDSSPSKNDHIKHFILMGHRKHRHQVLSPGYWIDRHNTKRSFRLSSLITLSQLAESIAFRISLFCWLLVFINIRSLSLFLLLQQVQVHQKWNSNASFLRFRCWSFAGSSSRENHTSSFAYVEIFGSTNSK